jgi:ribosomal protein L27
MRRKQHGPDQIILKQREADAMLGTGTGIGRDVPHFIDISTRCSSRTSRKVSSTTR